MMDRIGRPATAEPGSIQLHDLMNPEALRKAQLQTIRYETDRRVLSFFRDVDHAKQVWDDWDGIDGPENSGEDAHWYLNMKGYGDYCAV